MRQILIPIDEGEPARTRSAVAQAIRIYRSEPVQLRLVNVQPQLNGHVAMYFGVEELRRLQQEAGRDALATAQDMLDDAGIPYASTVLTGRSAEVIAEAARRFCCDRIVFGEPEASLAGRMFGSLAEQVRQLLPTHWYQVLGS
ncbi:universal stress protein [Variovorax dokdonensis]|uniref:Universal stress protein n=1 Tax=Variovorax dokdonensis TaxID=344883 RepID=A0ABT7N6S6_9BURK|nr:universal stress protein [Variovorax dokdonensis]MDM0043644.1 universal stress protein [Variovorax dokdonensis]